MTIPYRSSEFSRSVWLPMGVFVVFAILFGFYVSLEKEIDRQNDIRFQSSALANELRQSSDDLTRMVRTYVATGNRLYKDHYFNILAIREGKAPRPLKHEHNSWGLSLPGYFADHHSNAPAELMHLIDQAGFSPDELMKLKQAKRRSDNLAQLERTAFALYDSTQPVTEEHRKQATEMLYNSSYHRAKAEIMELLADAQRSMERRTTYAVEEAIDNALYARILVLMTGLLLLFLLWRAYQALHTILGGSLEELHERLQALGSGDFSAPIAIYKRKGENVLAWMADTQQQLAQKEIERREAEARNLRLTRLYNTLSQCNQAIVRSANQSDLFPQICRDAVIHGGMKMAWIGLLDVRTQTLLPVASYGTGTQHINGAKISLDADQASGRGPSAIAFRESRPYWCQDYQHDPVTAPWHHRGVEYGWQSSAAIPLKKNGSVVGTFNLYAEEKNAFDHSAQSLLEEMATDISYALSNFDLEAQREHAQQMEELRTFMLERISSTMPLHDILRAVTHKLESIIPGSLCSILMLDKEGLHLQPVATDSFPACYNVALDGLAIGAGVGSCGNTAFTGERTIVDDIANHPYWDDFRDLAENADLGACWSEPILSSNNKTLGAFAIYHRKPTAPNQFEIQLLEMAAHFVSITIERKQSEAELRKLSLAVEQSSSTIIVTDVAANIEYVNESFVRNTGYSRNDVMGANPRILKSGKTPDITYASMWSNLVQGKSWQGELINIRKDQTEYVNFVNIAPVRDIYGNVTHYLAIADDITERKQAEERIQFLAHFDALTNLPNRTLLDERAAYAFSLAKRSQEPLAVIFFDLDHFKDINDSLGHSVGDGLLIVLAERLRQMLRDDDTISRLGGDEFVLLLPGADSRGAEQVSQKLLNLISQPFNVGTYDLNVTCSIGISIFPNDGEDLETLSKNADAAMYRAKQEGRNCYRFFTQEMQERSARHLELLNALRHAQERGQLQIHYQPQVSLSTRRIIGAEALLRWEHPELGVISPTEFIPVAEESRLILPIGEWILRCAVQQLKTWMDAGFGPMVMAVNLSAVQFRMNDLPDVITRILEEVGLPPEYLELELTEGVAMHEPHGAIAVMAKLHDRGVRMSIDDFGTGYSSLNYLKKFNAYKLKIDQSFVRDITIDAEDKAIVSAIIQMARSLGLRTIAEGVETEEQLEFLREQGCDELQGFYYSSALPADQFEQILRNEVANPFI